MSDNEIKRLYRSKKETVIAGVCGGLAEYLNLDPVVVRILAVVAAMAGVGLIFYIAAVFIIPENPRQVLTEEEKVKAKAKKVEHKGDWNLAIGIVLVIFGAIFLFNHFDIWPMGILEFSFFPWRIIWPLVFVAVGIYLLTSGQAVQESAQNMKEWAKEHNLRKSATDKKVAGVCGGFAEHFGIDSNILRIALVFLAIVTHGLAVIGYVAAAILMKSEEKPVENGEHNHSN